MLYNDEKKVVLPSSNKRPKSSPIPKSQKEILTGQEEFEKLRMIRKNHAEIYSKNKKNKEGGFLNKIIQDLHEEEKRINKFRQTPDNTAKRAKTLKNYLGIIKMELNKYNANFKKAKSSLNVKKKEVESTKLKHKKYNRQEMIARINKSLNKQMGSYINHIEKQSTRLRHLIFSYDYNAAHYDFLSKSNNRSKLLNFASTLKNLKPYCNDIGEFYNYIDRELYGLISYLRSNINRLEYDRLEIAFMAIDFM